MFTYPILGKGRKRGNRFPPECLESTHLSQGGLLAATEKRRRVSKQRLDLLDNRVGGRLANLGPGLVRLGRHALEDRGEDLGEEGVDEEADAGAAQGAVRGVGGREQVRGEGVGEELGDDGGFGDDLAVVRERGDEAAGVDLQVLFGAGFVEIDNLLFEGNVELGEGNVSTVGPCGISV